MGKANEWLTKPPKPIKTTMQQLRKPLEGVGNIVRFNWHFYALAAGAALWLLALSWHGTGPVRLGAVVALGLVGGTTAVSLLVSYYIYDCSALYSLNWLGPAAGPVPWVKPEVNVPRKPWPHSALRSTPFL